LAELIKSQRKSQAVTAGCQPRFAQGNSGVRTRRPNGRAANSAVLICCAFLVQGDQSSSGNELQIQKLKQIFKHPIRG
jgi:hypothetical protein